MAGGDAVSRITCPACGHEFEVEVRPAAPEPPPRRWARRLALAALALLAAGACMAWVLAK